MARLRTEDSRIQFLQDKRFFPFSIKMSDLSLSYPASCSVGKDGSLVAGKGAISSIVKVKNEWSSTSTPPISLYDRKGDVMCQLILGY